MLNLPTNKHYSYLDVLPLPLFLLILPPALGTSDTVDAALLEEDAAAKQQQLLPVQRKLLPLLTWNF